LKGAIKMNGIKVDIINNTIIINKTFSKRMANTDSPEYREYERIISVNPTFKVTVKTQKTYNHDKYKGLNYSFIEAYIYCHEIDMTARKNAFAEYIEERWKSVGHSCGFHEVRAWFLNKYPEFDNLYFKKNQEPQRSQIEEIINCYIRVENGELIFSEGQKRLTA